MKKRILAAGAAALFALSACGNDSGNEAGEPSKSIVIGMANWEDAIAPAHLWKHVLEEKGYDVTLQNVDLGAAFLSLDAGDIDAIPNVWLPTTHANYMDEYGDELVDLGAWYNDAKLAIAVNEDAPITSLDELADNADLFDNQIVGIEPGAGEMELVEDVTIPAYGLENMPLRSSSTPAMLAELKTATESGENIAVTLWSPHWAYEAFPIRDLEDPQGTLGDAETISFYGRNGFDTDFPEVTEWLNNFTLSPEQLADLENRMFNENEDPTKYPEIVDEWITDNQEFVDSLTREL